MAIATLYTCDISGYQSTNAEEFHKITLVQQPVNSISWQSASHVIYLHEPVAQRLHLSHRRAVEPSPAPSTEALLLELISSIASEAAIEAVANR